MNIEDVGKLLSEFIQNIIVMDLNKKIVWTSTAVQKELNIEMSDELLFNDLFEAPFHKISEPEYIYTFKNGKNFNIFSKTIGGYTFIFLEDIENLYNDKNKLHCLETIISSISDGIILSDIEGKIVLYNEAQEKLEGLSREKIQNKYLWEAYNYETKEMSEHQRVLRSGKPIINKYKAHTFKDNVPQYTSYSTYPIEKNNKRIGVFSVSKNETMLKDLLCETIELKRQLFSDEVSESREYSKNGTMYTFEDIVGDSDQIKQVIREAKNIAMLDNNFLIFGETGTGKEVFAQSIHNLGEKSKEPFVPINCGAIPEGLFEGILFGTVKGAYTGAKDQIGLFEEAGNGTLFLDELNSMPISMQTKLLRVLQEKRVRRVGGLKTIPVNCRIITAVNEDPEKLIEEGRLREDLFYRIAGFCLHIPSLRERKVDILSMSYYFIKKFNRKLSKGIMDFSSELRQLMLDYSWPGNVRELEHVVENLIIRTKQEEKILKLQHLPRHIKHKIIDKKHQVMITEESTSLTDTLKNIEKQIIIRKLNENEWNVSQTARDLGIIRQSLIYRMKKLNIEKKR